MSTCSQTGHACRCRPGCYFKGNCKADFAQRRQLVELLIDRVVVTDGDVEICYIIPLSPDGERGRACSSSS